MRKRSGCLVKKRGLFYLQVSETDPITGNRKRIWLATGERNRRAAEAKAEKLFAPFAARDTADRLAHIAGTVDAAKATAAALEDAADPGLMVRDAFDAYERHPDRPDAGEATMRQYLCQWNRFERWLADHYPEATRLRQVSPEIARAFMDKLSVERASPNTWNKYRNFLALVFRVLAKPGRVSVNPFDGLKPRKLQTAHRRALTVDELRLVCGKASGEMRVLLALGVYTGARLGDCCTMTWGHIDLARNEIRYSPRKTASRTDGKRLTIPVHPVLAGILAETPPNTRKGYVLPVYAALYLEKGPTAITQRVQRHFEKCGIETKGETRGKRQRAAVEVGFHSLRHTAVSMLRDAGASMSAAMAITGHSSAALLDVYTHAGADSVLRAVNALPAITGDETPRPRASDDAFLTKLRELAARISPDNIETIKAELSNIARVYEN